MKIKIKFDSNEATHFCDKEMPTAGSNCTFLESMSILLLRKAKTTG